MWLFLTFVYILFHISLYILIGRNICRLRTEFGIFLFHLSSFLLLGIISIFVLIGNQNILILLLGILSLHGIYSISFLELWSLSQGSYSIKILELSPITLATNSNKLDILESLGDTKFIDRVESLQKIYLLHSDNDTLKVTCFGRIVAKILLTFARIANISNRG